MAKTSEDLIREFINYQKDKDKASFGSGLSGSLESLKKAVTPTTDTFNTLKNSLTTNIDTWRKLSNVGANFSNDVVGMSLAAVEARVSLADFADIIGKSAVSLAGLGGSVSRGVEAFAKLTKEFQDTSFSKDLMNLGYTTKEINETLALNLGFQKSTMKMDSDGKTAAFASAKKLADEMDMVAKLTGKSRSEQERTLREAQRNGEVEAKMRLIGLRDGAEAEKKARAEFAGQLVKAEAMGMGALFQDMFTKGVPASEEAAVQLSMAGKAGAELSKSAAAMGKGLTDEAAAAMKRAEVANAALQKNEAYLQTAAVGSLAGLPGQIAKRGVEVNDALYQSVERIAETNGIVLKSQQDYAKALDLIRLDLLRSQTGFAQGEKDAVGKKVSGATEGIIAAEKGIRDAAAGIASSMDAANNSGKTIADSLRNVGSAVEGAVDDMGDIRTRIASSAEAGLKGKEGGGLIGVAAAGGQLAAEGLEKFATTGIRLGAAPLAEKPASLPAQGGTPVQVREKGGPVDAGTPYLVGEGGKAEIFVPKSAGDIVPMDKIGTKFPPAEDNQTTSKASGGFDIRTVSKDIATHISSVVSGGSTTTKQVQNDDSKAAEAEMKALSAKFKEDQAARRAIVQEGMAVEDRKFSKVQAALKLDEETIKIKEAYEKRREELAKKVADGTTWEIENKQSSAEETKKIIESEILTKAQFTDKLQSDEKKIADIRAKFGSEAAETHAQEVEQKRQSLESTRVMIKNELSSTKSIIGKSVEGLTDDMIESMLPEGSILEDYYVDINGKLQSFVDDSAAVIKDSFSATGTYLTDIERKNTALKAAEKQGSTKVSDAGTTSAAQKLAQQRVENSEKLKSSAVDDKGKINLNKLNLPGMSDFGSALAPKDPKGTDAKGAAASISEEAKKAEAAKTEAAKKAEAAKPPVNAQKVASLDDVVKSLDRLNIQMGQLIIQQSDLIKKQTTTMLSAGSSNIYDRTR